MLETVSRRDVLKGAAASVPVTLAGASLASILADPKLAHAAAGTTQTVSIKLEDGRTVEAALAVPDVTPAPAVLLVHEWWGLNDQIKTMAAEMAKEGYLALAVDLYGGNVAKTPDEARANMQAMKANEASITLKGWTAWLKSESRSTGKVGTLGWCLGGGWSLMASILTPVDATVVYYGKVDYEPMLLGNLQSPVLGHFGTKDKRINAEMVAKFEAGMKEVGKPYTVHWYEADHAFANPTGARYDEADTKLAWDRTRAFFVEHLK